MGAQDKKREARRNLILPARLRDDGGWHDVTIRNVSSRGLMATCEAPPPKGAFVEIRHRTICIVGNVRWSHGNRFGLRSQDRIDIIGLVAGQASPTASPAQDRRTAARAPEPALAATTERSRRMARIVNWSIAGIAVAAAAGIIAGAVESALRAPLGQVATAMGGG